MDWWVKRAKLEGEKYLEEYICVQSERAFHSREQRYFPFGLGLADKHTKKLGGAPLAGFVIHPSTELLRPPLLANYVIKLPKCPVNQILLPDLLKQWT